MWLAVLLATGGGLFNVPPAGWHSVTVVVPAANSTLTVNFEVKQGSKAQVLLLDHAQAVRFRRGRSFEALAATGFSDTGRLRQPVAAAGDYVLMIDNRIDARQSAVVQLDVDLQEDRSSQVRELSPERRRAVVAISLVLFGALVSGSAMLMLRRL
ncbi:MAG TPA: hypothetical protein VES20_11330 [Bryobacteraceae bacterium]|nr:hypothetical protein [Bryobacteraceae bacterium]